MYLIFSAILQLQYMQMNGSQCLSIFYRKKLHHPIVFNSFFQSNCFLVEDCITVLAAAVNFWQPFRLNMPMSVSAPECPARQDYNGVMFVALWQGVDNIARKLSLTARAAFSSIPAAGLRLSEWVSEWVSLWLTDVELCIQHAAAFDARQFCCLAATLVRYVRKSMYSILVSGKYFELNQQMLSNTACLCSAVKKRKM